MYTSVFLPGEFHGQMSLAGTFHGVAKSWTLLSNRGKKTSGNRGCRMVETVAMTKELREIKPWDDASTVDLVS